MIPVSLYLGFQDHGLRLLSTPRLLCHNSPTSRSGQLQASSRKSRVLFPRATVKFELRNILAGPLTLCRVLSHAFIFLSPSSRDRATACLFQSRLSSHWQNDASPRLVGGLAISVSRACLTSFPLTYPFRRLGDGSETLLCTLDRLLFPVLMRAPSWVCHVSQNVSFV